jgi:hypothetical protein
MERPEDDRHRPHDHRAIGTGTLKGGLLSERTLVNEGTITFAQNYLEMTEGALLENRGTFVDKGSRLG